MSATELLLIDLSSLAHPLYHISSKEPDPDWTSAQIVARVRALSSQHPHAAICCDTGRSFRNDLSPRVALGDGKYAGYKADRPERDARLYHQIDIAIDRLKQDGYPIWSAENFEADDVIATAARLALSCEDTTVLICSADKDLLQLVSPRVRWKSVAPGADGVIRDEAAIVAKFGVNAVQLHDWLCLVGDSSDNVVGARGIGAIKATELLKKHGSLDAVYAAMDRGVVPGITPGIRSSLVEFRDRRALVSELIRLRDDVPAVIAQFAEIDAERVAPPMEEQMSEPFKESDDSNDAPLPDAMRELDQNESLAALSGATAKAVERIERQESKVATAAVGRVVAEQPAPVSTAPVEFSQQLEPRSMQDAVVLADRMYQSRLFSAYGTPQAVLATIMAGREIGMPAMASLRAFHIIEGKPTLSAGAIQAMVINSKKATYFRCTERTAERATFVTKRGDDPEIALTFTVEEARRAFGFRPEMEPKAKAEKETKWNASGWGKNPADNCVARASSKLARLVYPDVVSGLYAPEEME